MELLSLAPSSKCRTYSIPTMGNVKEGGGIGQKQRGEVKLMKSLVPPLMAALVALSPISNPPVSLGQAIDIQRGATLFGRSCIGCHDGGGNIIQQGATLFLKDLQRNEVDTEEEIFRVTYYGKGRMPGFGENCTPRGQCTFGAHLQEEEIKLLAEFVKSQAEQGPQFLHLNVEVNLYLLHPFLRSGCISSPVDVPKIIWQVVDSVAKANNPHAALPFGLLVTDMLLELRVPTRPDDEWKE
ncbi:hypothetical protein LOK49_LG09G02641 [Camellia lanceoleosa]|uniref:Uncharacterized protein n=1 Tax=Camellia lanceoleosa TaxID=1840588 RepID=A0ACC0GGM2_9ERIC|nr:hypothetical protein LOK49_LG09G02641 [Camellia lanceoleosa]